VAHSRSPVILIYIPPETSLLAAASTRGNITVNGLGLLPKPKVEVAWLGQSAFRLVQVRNLDDNG
jgi:shikimate 5-dehydrogenase